MSTSPSDQAQPPNQAAPPGPTPPTRALYPIPGRALRAMAFTLPRPGDDEPESASQEEVEIALDTLAALDPRNPIEVILALQIIAAAAGAQDAHRLAFEPGASEAQAHRHRASATAMTRTVTTAMRLLNQQWKRPVGPRRDWDDAAADVGAAWRQAPARPMEPTRTGGKAAADDTPETIVKWIDEIDDAEVQIATEQDRREKAGEPPLPRKPGQPIVLYRYKPTDYIHKFSPDPKSWQKYLGFENMTMAERRAMFGYTYTGPNGPPEALTPASRDEMLKQIESEKLLDAEQRPPPLPLPLREGVGGRGLGEQRQRQVLAPTLNPTRPQRPLPLTA